MNASAVRSQSRQCAGTTDLSTHQITSLQSPFPSVFMFPDSSDLNVGYVYQVKVVDKNIATLTESSLFYLELAAHPAPAILDRQSTDMSLSKSDSAGLAVGLIVVIALLALGGWRLRRFLKNRSITKRRAGIRASIRHLVPQKPVEDAVELYKVSSQASWQFRGHNGEPPRQETPPHCLYSPI